MVLIVLSVLCYLAAIARGQIWNLVPNMRDPATGGRSQYCINHYGNRGGVFRHHNFNFKDWGLGEIHVTVFDQDNTHRPANVHATYSGGRLNNMRYGWVDGAWWNQRDPRLRQAYDSFMQQWLNDPREWPHRPQIVPADYTDRFRAARTARNQHQFNQQFPNRPAPQTPHTVDNPDIGRQRTSTAGRLQRHASHGSLPQPGSRPVVRRTASPGRGRRGTSPGRAQRASSW